MTASTIATGATQLLVTRTARLRATLRQIDPYSAALVATVVAVLLALGLRGDTAPAAQTAPQSPIIVIATPTLGVAAAPAHGVAREASSARNRSMMPRSAPAAPLAPVPAPPAAPEQPQVQVLQVQQVEPTSAPAATTESHWEGDSYVINGSTVPTVAPADVGRVDSQGWVCGKPYGDWRDSDPMYTHPECYPVRVGK